LYEFHSVCWKQEIRKDKFGAHIAHIIAASSGGPYEAWNLVPACPTCNGECGAQNLIDFMGNRGLPIFQHLLTKK
jgi:hypothetical protein